MSWIASHLSVLNHRIREDRGASAVEYGLLVGLIAVVIIGAVATLGGHLDGLFDKVGEAIGQVNETGTYTPDTP